eukprot:CAMPEP_0170596404 /NCGR_PEP_ID=MMETSP0224-20130122/15097_1 /TAXON_ID=285029 /ORGANISM="Togula jolla, Strain CCCM 725" /LENGTH=43 /DNA_ID= /DNA_START= /DNA_END= /DNA_ORIENTATION=
MAQRIRSGAWVIVVLAAVAAFSVLPSRDAFVGARPSQGASRVA